HNDAPAIGRTRGAESIGARRSKESHAKQRRREAAPRAENRQAARTQAALDQAPRPACRRSRMANRVLGVRARDRHPAVTPPPAMARLVLPAPPAAVSLM